MDNIFGERNDFVDEWLDSMDGNQSIATNESTDALDSGYVDDNHLTTTIEKSMDVSPIRNTSNADRSSLFDFDEDLSFDKSKSSRKYFSSKRSLPFSPIFGSTPKPSKTKSKTTRRTQNKRKKSYKRREDISLWTKRSSKM